MTVRGGRGGVAAAQLVDAADTAMADTMLDPNRASLRPKLIWFNLALTVAVMVLLVLDIFPLSYVFMVGAAVALMVNFPKLKSQADEIVAHAPSIVGVVSMVLAAGVLVGVLNGTGMVTAMASWITTVIPASMGPFLAVITGILSIPFTFFMSNDAFYFGILPVLSESAAHFGIEPVEMARASITGQPVHLQSPLVPAILLLVSLANVNLGDHHKKVLWRACVVSLAMLAVGVLVGSIPFAASDGSRSANGPLRAVQGTIRAPSVGRQRVSVSSAPSRHRSRRSGARGRCDRPRAARCRWSRAARSPRRV